MTPAPGDRQKRFVGDWVRFDVRDRNGTAPPKGWHARLRTNLGRGKILRREIIQAHTQGIPLAGASWHDVVMQAGDNAWSIEIALTEPGYFKAKAYLVDPSGWQHWPEGPDTGISVHPNAYRTANTIYCAFPRLFDPATFAAAANDEDPQLAALDRAGYTVIPPSGKLRDLTRELPHILDRLGCRILHLLPVNPTPTTMARMGRFGSPYAALDLTAIDPALVVFDKRSTGIDQFRELTYATHLRGGRVILDLVINHTGWGSVLHENHPNWFMRAADGSFASPGAWSVTWEDLVELKHDNVGLWDKLAQVFLTWCRRGVDGFRCDAGYKVPIAAWQYIVARVQEEYPDALFLLEGLGGAWETTEALLADGGMQWAYSELFQNYSGPQVAAYLDHGIRQSDRAGLLVHFSETHDNDRLAAKGRAWSLLRNRLCALSSVGGAFGFTCGVEWQATQKIKVHGKAGLAWGNQENLVTELAQLNQLMADHPCFFDGAKLRRMSSIDSPVYVLQRESEEGKDAVLIVVNNDLDNAQTITLDAAIFEEHATGDPPARESSKRTRKISATEDDTTPPAALAGWTDLLGQKNPEVRPADNNKLTFTLAQGATYCLAPTKQPRGLHGTAYSRARDRAAWGVKALGQVRPAETIGAYPWRELAVLVDSDPARFLTAISRLKPGQPLSELPKVIAQPQVPRVILWTLGDARRVTLVPPNCWLLIHDSVSFRASLAFADDVENVESIAVRSGHIAWFPPRTAAGDAQLTLERYTESDQRIEAAIRFLGPESSSTQQLPRATDIVLLTNGRGGMARFCIDLGRVSSKYDCVLGANLHPTLPVDRHVFAKRIRAWINADGFIAPLDLRALAGFEAGPPAIWQFVANAGDGRQVAIQMRAEMPEGRNSTVFRFSRLSASPNVARPLPAEKDVRLSVRIDIEDRNFHGETKRNSGADHHFSSHTHPIPAPKRKRKESAGSESGEFIGLAFTPARDRQLRVFVDRGCYHPQAEWSENIPHPVEQSRGQVGSGDAFSPGWFELPLHEGEETVLVVTAETADFETIETAARIPKPAHKMKAFAEEDSFGKQLLSAAQAFVVRRDNGKTVIAGYPWFLDWGRDTFICARGLLAAGQADEVRQVVLTFARFEKDGTLPNTIHGEDASNRDTSDAPLWLGVVCEELATTAGDSLYETKAGSRVITEVLSSIATNYIKGTPNGIRMDPRSALIWSPSHFTWMDTNHPACTPREGYPVEIQALWIRLLRQLERISPRNQGKKWGELAAQASESINKLFWREERGWFGDHLIARRDQTAAEAVADDALRTNCLLGIALGLMSGERAQLTVAAAERYLVVPGALRTLAPLPVSVPLPNRGSNGRLLNDPSAPYWGHYEGDEDTRRKPAYHNGTAWTWTFPMFCEALARAWDIAPEAVSTARAYLGSMDRLLTEGCLGQIPEIVDGDAPHTQRGCDAQAWSVTEALRVWRFLDSAYQPT